MKCSQVREVLQDGRGWLRLIPVCPHLVLCRQCRSAARYLLKVQQALRESGRFAPPADLLPNILAVPQYEPHIETKNKEPRKMRHFAYAGIAVLVLAVAAGILISGRGEVPDAMSLLSSVAQAMENATSIHMVSRGQAIDPNSPSGMRISSDRAEVWLSDRAMYMREIDQDGTLTSFSVVDFDSGEFCSYRRGTLYVADITPVYDGALGVIAGARDLFVGGRLKAILANARDVEVLSTNRTRNSTVISYAYRIPSAPPQTGRVVLELDRRTSRLSSMLAYAQAEGADEELIAAVDLIEYDVPLPPVSSFAVIPEGTATVQAVVSIKEEMVEGVGRVRDLDMKVGDTRVFHMSALAKD